jgi:hypothetical protein
MSDHRNGGGGGGGGGGGHKRRRSEEGGRRRHGDKRRHRDDGTSSSSSSSSSSSASTSASGSSWASDESPTDDDVGHLAARPGDWLGKDGRYKVLADSGKGTFGKVLLCEDARHRRLVAIKVVRRVRKYTEAARVEAAILEDVNKADPAGASLTVRYYAAFEHRGHFCMVFEPLGPSLYDYHTANQYRPPPLYCVQHFADQLVASVAYLHELRLIHTYLKLENILLVSREPYDRTTKPNSTRKTGKLLVPVNTEIRRAWRAWRACGAFGRVGGWVGGARRGAGCQVAGGARRDEPARRALTRRTRCCAGCHLVRHLVRPRVRVPLSATATTLQ